MCTVLLPPGVNPTAVNKYININISKWQIHERCHTLYFYCHLLKITSWICRFLFNRSEHIYFPQKWNWRCQIITECGQTACSSSSCLEAAPGSRATVCIVSVTLRQVKPRNMCVWNYDIKQLKTERALNIKIQLVPRSKHTPSQL